MALINQYSFLWGALILLIIVAVLLLRDGPKRTDFLILGVILIALGGLWLGVRPRATQLTHAAQVQAQIGAGTPVLLEFQSPY